jgi:hypothetical protein
MLLQLAIAADWDDKHLLGDITPGLVYKVWTVAPQNTKRDPTKSANDYN